MSRWVPGTYEEGFVEPRFVEIGDDYVREQLHALGSRGVKFFQAGMLHVIVAREPAGANAEKLWHLTISRTDRHPSWDEIKFARYRLLPRDRCFGMLLPQPQFYINIVEQDHVFHLWEVTDPREPWTAE